MVRSFLLSTTAGWLGLVLGGWPVASANLPAARQAPAGPVGVEVHIAPVVGTQPLVLDEQAYPAAHNGAVTISTCRFYLSALRLTYADGSSYTEPASYHLIDAADTSTFRVRLPQAPRRPVHSLSFSVGVDSLTNVTGAHGGDLEPGRGMYWAWHSGYVNAKLEGNSPVCPGPRHEFAWHVGGFQRPYASLRRVTLPVPARAAAPRLLVLADVGAWLHHVRLADVASVLVPGPAAQTVADGYATMFRLAPASQP